MSEQFSQVGDPQPAPESPLHGYRGERSGAQPPFLPGGLTVAISREAGSRGTSIAQRAGEKLGWQVYTQEMLEYIGQQATVHEEINANLPPTASHWVQEQLQHLQAGQRSTAVSPPPEMARIILSLAANGEVILIGRGAGYVLPRASTLHVRVIAPLEDRIAYMSQWQRLTRDEAAEQVRLRDRRRAEYLRSHYHREATDIYQYDLLLNSTFLCEELSAELLVQAARAKATTLRADSST